MLKIFIIILISLILFYSFFGKQYYLIALLLVRILPYLFIYELFTLNYRFFLFIFCYIIYKILNDRLFAIKLPYSDSIFGHHFLLDSTNFIDIQFNNQLKINEKKNYIFLYSPHAIYNQGFIYLFGNDKQKFNKKTIPLVHSFFKCVPVVSELFSCFGFMECSKSNINYLLDKKHSIVLSPGGIKELFLTKEKEENIYIKKRNTIFNIAIEKKIEIVPVLGIGESDWYKFLNISKYLPNKYLLLSSYLFSWGKKYKPWLPINNKLTISFGTPISLYWKNGSLKNIQELKTEYIIQLKQLHHTGNELNKTQRKINIY